MRSGSRPNHFVEENAWIYFRERKPAHVRDWLLGHGPCIILLNLMRSTQAYDLKVARLYVALYQSPRGDNGFAVPD